MREAIYFFVCRVVSKGLALACKFTCRKVLQIALKSMRNGPSGTSFVARDWPVTKARQRTNEALSRHRKHGHFILANLGYSIRTPHRSGNRYRTFAAWKPEAPRATYIPDDELNEEKPGSSVCASYIKAAGPPLDVSNGRHDAAMSDNSE